MRDDVQEPDLRCGTPGTSWHVTTKSSIHAWGVLYKSGVHAWKVVCLTLGDLSGVLFGTEAGAIRSDRLAEVSRGHIRYEAGQASEALQC